LLFFAKGKLIFIFKEKVIFKGLFSKIVKRKIVKPYITMLVRRKSESVESFQFSYSEIVSAQVFIGESEEYPKCKRGGLFSVTGRFKLKIGGKIYTLKEGDWIIKDSRERLSLCRKENFDRVYEKV